MPISRDPVSLFEHLVPLLLSVMVSVCVVTLLRYLDVTGILDDVGAVGRPGQNCPAGTFRLTGMTSCEPWLDCSSISREVKVYQELHYSRLRHFHLAKWGRNLVTYSGPATAVGNNSDNLLEPLHLLQELAGNKFVAQLIGYCLATGVIVTEYHRLVTASHVLTRSGRYSPLDRLNLCVSYAELLTLLHGHSPPLLLCRVSSPRTLLSQMVVTAAGDQLLLWDMTALVSLSTNNTNICNSGVEEDEPEGAPPEQGLGADSPGLTEAVDIWRAPSICSAFLGQVEGAKSVKNLLQPVHRRCRDRDPAGRPTARDLLKYYREVVSVWDHQGPGTTLATTLGNNRLQKWLI